MTLNAKAKSNTEVELSWNDKGESFEIERAGLNDFSRIATSASSPYVDVIAPPGLTGQNYRYRVRPVVGGTPGAYSNIAAPTSVSGTVPRDPKDEPVRAPAVPGRPGVPGTPGNPRAPRTEKELEKHGLTVQPGTVPAEDNRNIVPTTFDVTFNSSPRFEGRDTLNDRERNTPLVRGAGSTMGVSPSGGSNVGPNFSPARDAAGNPLPPRPGEASDKESIAAQIDAYVVGNHLSPQTAAVLKAVAGSMPTRYLHADGRTHDDGVLAQVRIICSV